MPDFNYLSPTDIYLDAACQSLRPQPVIDALNDYYTKFNSCGDRGKYQWSQKTDQKVTATRDKLIKYLHLKPRDYFVSFTLNTTYGINLLLSQLRTTKIKKVITSDIEHNSPFLATITFAERHQIKREVVTRNPDGSLPLENLNLDHALVVLNCASNIDGRQLLNIKEVTKAVHQQNGFIIIDAAQGAAHTPEILYKTSPDAICLSAHKMYAPSLGAMVIHKDFARHIDTTFIGGGMVDDVGHDTYELSSDRPDHLHTKFEAGLQAWGEIIAFGAALDWLTALPKSAHQNLIQNSTKLYNFLANHPKVHLINQNPNPTMSFYIEGLDSHLIGQALADEHISVRTGYFCAHYYLAHVMNYPPLVRFSLGYHTRPEDIDRVIQILSRIK